MAQGQRNTVFVNDTGLTTVELLAIGLSAVWVVAVGLFAFFMPAAPVGAGPLQILVLIMAVFLPVAMFWVAATAARTTRVMKDESARLQAAVDALRAAYVADRKSSAAAPTVEAKLNEIAQTARKTESTLATFTTSRDGSKPKVTITSVRQVGSDNQATLALGTQAEDTAPPLPRIDFIRALNFPDNDKDVPGFDALRRALKDRTARQLVQAAQDVLTLLSQDGIYMDDLTPDRARPEVWRRFAMGERGRSMAALGGIRDRSSLALSAGRMREDTIFRDAAHHFLRLFDKGLVNFEPEASDEEIAQLADTRSARAFMVLGRVTGAFD
ncbi:hypothetical protein [Loktanella salsilacus]|uniref:hypothetical protein n=1 Tax=Loktanella salsilacus TaxID=195913 RepID=UPI0022019C25|nr:hypothetical protein KBK07_12135 [Loktanella salsilacus]